MKIFEYSLFAKLVYKYGNIPITFFLILYTIVSLTTILQNIYYVVFAIINLLLIYFINKKYFEIYKHFPFRIEVDDEKIVGVNFFFLRKRIEIRFEEITELTGGIFDGKLYKPMYIQGRDSNFKIGFYNHIKNIKDLATIILTKIPKSKYEELMNNLYEKAKAKQSRQRRKRGD